MFKIIFYINLNILYKFYKNFIYSSIDVFSYYLFSYWCIYNLPWNILYKFKFFQNVKAYVLEKKIF